MMASTRQENTRERWMENVFAYAPYQIASEMLLKAANMRVAQRKIPLFHVKTLAEQLRCWDSTIETMRKTKNTQKRWAAPRWQPTAGVEWEGRYRAAQSGSQCATVREDWFLSFFLLIASVWSAVSRLVFSVRSQISKRLHVMLILCVFIVS